MSALIIWGSLGIVIVMVVVFILWRLRTLPSWTFLRCLLTYDDVAQGVFEMAKGAATLLAFGSTLIGLVYQQDLEFVADSPDFKSLLLFFSTITAIGLLCYLSARNRLLLYFAGDIFVYWASIGGCATFMWMLVHIVSLESVQLVLMEAVLAGAIGLIIWREILETSTFWCLVCAPAHKRGQDHEDVD